MQTNRLSSPSTLFRHWDFFKFLLSPPLFWMMALLVIEAALSALTTWLVIKAGQDLATQAFLIVDFGWIVLAQSAAYGVGAVSWIFAERAGFGGFGRYMLAFTRNNRTDARLLTNKEQREFTEPFLTNETFHIFFELIYELEADLKLLFNLVFNTWVLGYALDAGLPLVYAAVFVALLAFQVSLRGRLAQVYLNNQNATNRMTAHTYRAWDNIVSGNRHNFRIWHHGFKLRLRMALGAQIRSIMAREGLSAIGGVFALVVIFAYLAYVLAHQQASLAMTMALAATLPKQIDLSSSVHALASGWNDLLAVWTRIKGACTTLQLIPAADFENRIDFGKLRFQPHELLGPRSPQTLQGLAQVRSVGELVGVIAELPVGWVSVRGANGAGKSTLLASLKARLGPSAYYWPTHAKLAYDFSEVVPAPLNGQDEEDDSQDGPQDSANGYSSGEHQLRSLEEIVKRTHLAVYLLDEWDANLDAANSGRARDLVSQLASRALVLEISHRD
jgi:ABC-type multidrug transport system fused ATPase/permease subunit